MKRSQAFPSKYLSKDDVATPVVARIADVRMETIPGDRADEEKAVMTFMDDRLKPMILNSTNWVTIEEVYGEETDDWRGKTVECYVDPGIMYAGKRVGGVRVRIPSGAGNGDNEVWTLEQAVAECEKVGLTRERLIQMLKDKGLSAYNGKRDTAAVKALIKEYMDSDIPF